MGSRDKGHKEQKKQKKDSKKTPSIDTFVQPPMTVEVVRKKRKERGGDED